jgi:hypothetical protein
MQNSILILFLLFPSFLFSQNLPINYETKKVEYTSVIDANGSKSELFLRAKNWTSSTFNSSQDLIQTKDEDYLAIKGLALIDYTIQAQDAPTVIEVPMYFTLELDFADNKYRYKITDIYFADTSDRSSVNIPIEETVLSRKEQEEIVAKRLNSSNVKLSKNEYAEALNVAFNRYDQFKSKGHWTIMGILQLITNGMANGIVNHDQ